MAWTYQQSTGDLTDPQGVIIGQGYAGHGAGLDNSADENIHNIGPLPTGNYTIGQFFDDPGGKGPIVAHLIPDPTNEMFGRSGFMIHGDTAACNHTASEGCIVLAHALRQTIASSGDNALIVVP
jgi:hypothetical protein